MREDLSVGGDHVSVPGGWFGASRTLIVAAMLAVLAPTAPVRAQDLFNLFGRRDPLAATSSDDARRDAVQAIPFEHIDREDRAKLTRVLRAPTFYRRMPIRVIDCDPDLYLFMLRNPDVIVNIWKVLGLSELEMRRDENGTFVINEPTGTRGTTRFVYRGAETHVLYAEGTYRGPVFNREIPGRCVVVLRSGYVREPNQRYYISTRMDSFVQIDDMPTELLTKTLHPVLTKTAENNFEQTLLFAGSLSRTAEVNHRGVQRLASRLEWVDPTRRTRLAELAASVAQKPSSLPQTGSNQPPEPAKPAVRLTGHAD